MIRGRIGIGRIGGYSLEFLSHPTLNPTPNPTPIQPKKLLRLWALSSIEVSGTRPKILRFAVDKINFFEV
jgi:hypothetical protein